MLSSFPVILANSFSLSVNYLLLACFFLALSASATFALDSYFLPGGIGCFFDLLSSFLGVSLARFGSFNMLDGGKSGAGDLDDYIG